MRIFRHFKTNYIDFHHVKVFLCSNKAAKKLPLLNLLCLAFVTKSYSDVLPVARKSFDHLRWLQSL